MSKISKKINRKVFFFVFLFLVMSICITTAYSPTHYRPIHINNTGGSEQTYYQVPLNITYDSDMKNDFSDIRVKNESSGEFVPYWIEDKVNGSWCKLWFNATSIPANSWCNDSYRLYYGDPSTTSASDGDATFEFFEDFDAFSGWEISEGLTVSSSILTQDASTEWIRRWTGTEKETFTSGILEFRAKFVTGTAGNTLVGFCEGLNGYPPYAAFTGRKSPLGIKIFTDYNDGQGPEIEDLGSTYLDEWYTWKIVRNSSGTYYYRDGNLLATHRADTSTPIGIMAITWGNTQEIDWIKFYNTDEELQWEIDFDGDEFYQYPGDTCEISVADSVVTVKSKEGLEEPWGKYVILTKPFKLNTALRARGKYGPIHSDENTKCMATGVRIYTTDKDIQHVTICIDQDTLPDNLRFWGGDGSSCTYGSFDNQYTDWITEEIIRTSNKNTFKIIGHESKEVTTTIMQDDLYVSIHSCNSPSEVKTDWILIRKYADLEPTALLGEEQNIGGSECTAPTISSLTNSTPTTNSVTITWTTNQSADNRVKYSKNSDLSNPLWSSWDNDTTSVSITLTGLDPNTVYYYQAWSYNSTNSSCYTTEPEGQPYNSFITQQETSEGCTSPEISSLTVSDITANSAVISWNTNQSSDNRVKYSKNSDLSNPSWSSWDNDTTSVSITLIGLDSNTTYYYQVWSYNGTNSSCYTTEPSSQPYENFTTMSMSESESSESHDIITIREWLSESQVTYELIFILIIVVVSVLVIRAFLFSGSITEEEIIIAVKFIILTIIVLIIGVAIIQNLEGLI